MDSKYSINEPQEVLSSDYLGTFLIRQNANQYACKKKTDTEEWWAIGMIANNGTWWHPLIVSNTEAYCYSYSDNYNDGNPLSNKTASFDYNGTTYYASFGAYGSLTIAPTNVSIPVYSETKSSDISHMAQILLGLHLQDGGTLPSGDDSSGNYQKVDYLRINWENKSESLKTPIDKGNLNKMDKAIADLCANLDIAHTESEVKKLDKSSANKLLSETPTWDAETGILTFKFFDGTCFSVDFNVEKIPVSFSMDSNGVITMTTDDGTEWSADVSKLIQDYNFNNGLRISFTKTKNEDGYEVSADLVKGSITEEYLEENYLANIISNVNASNTNASNADTSATNAANDAKLAQSYAIGSSGIRDGEDTDNAKYYSQQASKAKQELLDSMNIAGRGLTVEYDADSQRNVFALARECVQITDWNTQFYTGFYGSSVSANGVPSDAANYGTAFFGIVLQATDSANRSSVVYQTGIVYKNSRTDFSGIKKYERVYAQGQWSSWEDTNSLEDFLPTKKIRIFIDKSDSDYYRDIEPVSGNPAIKTPPIIVKGSATSYSSDSDNDISGEDYSYAQKKDVSFDVLDSLILSAQTTSGVKVTPGNSTRFGGGYYRVSGTATADVAIPLYSVSKPLSDALWFAGNISSSMSANTFYYLISDTAGNSVEIGTDADKTQSVKLGNHSGTVTVSLVVKSGTKVNLNAVVRGGYKKQYTYYDVSSQKYSDKIDNVADAVLDVKSTANFSHNLPRTVPKDITSYITDGSFYKRLNGTDGFELFEDIYVGDYIKMSRAITCPDSTSGTVGSRYVTIAGLDTMMYNGEDGKFVNYHHAVMVPGQGFGGTQHFGRHAMNATNTTAGGYAGSAMDQSVLGAVVSEGSTESGATINQQLYAEFGSHLKTTDELLSNSINETGTNRFGTANGCSNNWAWSMRQAVLMSEIEVYGSTVWSSSGYDTGNAKMQLPLFAHSRNAMNDRSGWYWLKDAASSARFCLCNDGGNAFYGGAGNAWGGVRPRFILS